jgi:hypothetical protein
MYNPQLAVFSTKPVINHGKTIVHVVHDPTGEWQFLSADNVTVEDLMIVALESLLERDHTLSEVIGIKPGYEATRDKVGAAWQIVEYKE